VRFELRVDELQRLVHRVHDLPALQDIERLTEAVAVGEAMAPLLAAIRTKDRRRADVVAGLATLDHVARMGGPELAGLHDTLQAHLADWQGLLRSAPVQGRQILRKLLVGRLTLTPRTEGTERYYEYAGEATLGRLLGGVIGSRATAMVTPGGSSEGWNASLTFSIDGVALAA
jgi:hypothetical protein